MVSFSGGFPACRKGEVQVFLLPTPHAGSCLHPDLEELSSQPTDVPGLSQPSASGCNEMMLLIWRGSVQKLLTIFCQTKRGERSSAHSHPCKDSAFLQGVEKWLSPGKPHPPGSEDEKCDLGSSQLPLPAPYQRLWKVNQRAFPKFRGP